jgi:HEPN domain-containing protein
MVDIGKQISFWRSGAEEDWEVAQALVARGNIRHGLFFAHLALEKALKALVCAQTADLAPRLHNLVRLAELVGQELSAAQIDTLAEMNVFALEGRYPDALAPPTTAAEAEVFLERAREVLECLMKT